MLRSWSAHDDNPRQQASTRHESRAGNRRVVVRLDIAKAERDVERLRVAHHRQRVEPDLAIAQPPRFVQRDRNELFGEAAPARRRAARRAASSRPPSRRTRPLGARATADTSAGRLVQRPQADHPDQPPRHPPRRTTRRAAARSRRATPRARRRFPGTRDRGRSTRHIPRSMRRTSGMSAGAAGRIVELSNRTHAPTVYLGVNAADLALPMLMMVDRRNRAARQPGSRSARGTCADRRSRRLRPVDRGSPDRRPPRRAGGGRPGDGRRRGGAGRVGRRLDPPPRAPGSRRVPRLVHADRLAQGDRSPAIDAVVARSLRGRRRPTIGRWNSPPRILRPTRC